MIQKISENKRESTIYSKKFTQKMLSRFININKNIVYKQNKIYSLFVPKNNCRQLQYFYSKSPNQDLTNPEIEQEIEELTYKQEEDLVKKYNQKYTKNKAMSDVVEQMSQPPKRRKKNYLN
ncbi:hypothetical protein PPERSA_11217 [Pseudocohnilembus persalinus]|uniref:Uncharacterized protein n=1 Tax=Pseudocohnilembus persalinus TaxID=266149 RepID=A0A0V0QZI2_PSEPJ|nr:hypothetical protein PPERSA_11217 [Pseudocohnilembus persalinus]|eukprot:KRX07668.1 hypothetical protein PPERSA_11217 [Pseudocohnilembus persalinus]